MNIQEFVKSLPEGLVYGPIYRKGAVMVSGKHATGKNPLEDSWDRKFGPADVALAMQRNSDLQAVGVWSGIRGNGIVILDVDANHKRWVREWGESLNGAPCITSTRPNAAKYLFRVPEELWGDVKGHGLRKDDGRSNGDYEILWGRQGVIYGAYPGKDGICAPGQYKFKGDLSNIPVAPDWLIAEMREPTPHVTKKDLDFSDRTEDEIAEIISDCLGVITPQGSGSREHWIRIGMAINSAMPNERGLMLWSAWSAEDADYAADWSEDINPCEEPWYSFKSGGIGFGTLIWLADREDKDRRRFSKETLEIVEAAEKRQVIESRVSLLSFEEVIKRGEAILELDNPAEVNYRLNALALQAGYRDQAALEKLLVDNQGFQSTENLITVEELMERDLKRDYLIPDVLPHPSVVLIYGAGGDGKSMSAWALAKHIATGSPFLVRGQHVPVKKGPVLILNGDQPLMQIKEQLQEVDFPVNDQTHIQTGFQLQSYAQFQKQMQELKKKHGCFPKLVIIDSLIGCSGGKAFDENKSEFASPLYWLTRNNGNSKKVVDEKGEPVLDENGKQLEEKLFESTILIIHHANKNGGFRGTSAIRDAVDETWSLSKPSEEEAARVGKHSRLITIEKSRSGRSGTQLIMQMQEDLSFSICDHTPELDKTNTSPASVSDRVLHKLRTVHPASRTTEDLANDPLIGKAAAIRKSLQRLHKRGLIEVTDETHQSQNGQALQSYRAVLACGEGLERVPTPPNPSPGAGSKVGRKARTNP